MNKNIKINIKKLCVGFQVQAPFQQKNKNKNKKLYNPRFKYIKL